MGRLTSVSVRTAKPGRHADGDGLYLLVKPSGARSFVLRIQQAGRRRDIGLGSAESRAREPSAADDIAILQRRVLTLAEAREKASILRRLSRAGHDLIVERDRDRRAIPSFKEAAIACHSELKAGWTSKHDKAFLASLEEHAFSHLGSLRVDQIEASHVRDALAAIWQEVPVMARKVRQRIGAVLNFARSKGWRSAEAPGRSVTLGLSRQARAGNFAAMPYVGVPAFVADLRSAAPTTGRSALLFVILTAARTGEVRAARWADIDLAAGTWNRPAETMKSREPHTVTLNEPAVALLKGVGAAAKSGLIFPGKGSAPLSDMTLTKILRDAEQPFTVHGFRSSFRDWAAERMPSIPDAVAEAALAHVVPDKVVRAYKRTAFLEMRRTLLDAWGRYVDGESAKVVRLPTARSRAGGVA